MKDISNNSDKKYINTNKKNITNEELKDFLCITPRNKENYSNVINPAFKQNGVDSKSILLNALNNSTNNMNKNHYTPIKGLTVVKGVRQTMYSCKHISVEELLVYYYNYRVKAKLITINMLY